MQYARGIIIFIHIAYRDIRSAHQRSANLATGTIRFVSNVN